MPAWLIWHSRRSGESDGDRAHSDAQGSAALGVFLGMVALVFLVLGVGLLTLLLGMMLAPLLLAMTRRWHPGHEAGYWTAVGAIFAGLLGFALASAAAIALFAWAMEYGGLAATLDSLFQPLSMQLLHGQEASAEWLRVGVSLSLLAPLLLPGLAVFAAVIAWDMGPPYRGKGGWRRALGVSLLLLALSAALVTAGTVGIMALLAPEPPPDMSPWQTPARSGGR